MAVEIDAHECFAGYVLVVGEDGREFMRECPECRMQRFARGAGGIPEHYRGMSWRHWRDRPQLSSAVAMLRDWTGEPWSLLLHPESRTNFGSGKTLAMCLTVRSWRERGLLSYYQPITRMVEHEGGLIDGSRLSMTGTATWAKGFEGLLALDDLGTEHRDKSGWAASLVESVLDARYAHDLPTIVSTNLFPARLEEMYPRAASRLAEGEMLVWEAADFRPKRRMRKSLRVVEPHNGKAAAAGPS